MNWEIDFPINVIFLHEKLLEILENYQEIASCLIAFLWIVVASNHLSKYIQRIKLPLITGFLISGIIVGPYFLNLVTKESLQQLQFVNNIALAFIAFAAGTELYLKEIRTNIKSIVWNTFGQLIITFIIGAIAVYTLAEYIPFMQNMTFAEKLAVSILTGTIFVARSPSSAIAVINEMKAKGSFTRIALSVTVIKDFLVILLFAISMGVAFTLIRGESFNIYNIAYILFGIVLTLFFGYITSLLLQTILSLRLKRYLKATSIIALGFATYIASDYLKELAEHGLIPEFHIEPLLVCIVASFRITNYTKYRIEFQKIIEDIGPAVYAAFFTFTGAMIAIDLLLELWLVALLMFAVRMAAVIIGALTGTALANDPKRFRKISWMPYITQAGVSLALVYQVAGDFPAWGNEFATIIIAMIVLNQLIGPPLFKIAIKMAKESHVPAIVKAKHTHKAIIFGFENQSVALGRELVKHNWFVDIVSRRKTEIGTNLNNLNTIYIESIFKESLEKLKLKKYDTLIMFLSDDENYRVVNYVNEYVGVETIIVRLNDRCNLSKFRSLDAIIVDPAVALVNLLDHYVRSPLATSLLLGTEEDKDSIDIVVKDKSLHGVALRDLRLPTDVLILSVKRKDHVIISHGYTRLRIGDVVTLVGAIESLEKIELEFEKQ